MVQVRITARSTGLRWRHIQGDARRNLERIVEKHGEYTADLASQLAPKRTGFLADHIEPEFDPVNLRSIIVALASYAGFVEYGTIFQAPQPFMTPALEAIKPLFLDEIRRELLK